MRFAAVKTVEQQSVLEAAGGRRPGMGDEVDLNQPGGGSFQSRGLSPAAISGTR
jgi:hypothetical protein